MMSQDKKSKRYRRDILKLAAVSASGVAVTPTVSAKSNQANNTVQTIKASIQNPIREKHIEQERNVVMNRLANRDDAPQSVVFDDKPVRENKILVGYALAVKNGAPVERTYSIPKNLLSKTDSGSLTKASETSSAQQRASEMEEAYHASIDEFVNRHEGESLHTMADPSWTFLGSVGDDRYATFQWNDETYYGGWGDIAVQIYGLPSINNDDSRDDNYYACTVSMGHQDPAWDGTNGISSDFPSDDNPYMIGPRNHHATIGIDWNHFDAYSSSDLLDYKPDSPESGDYSYSASLSISDTNAGSIGVSYDPAYINREAPNRTNDKVIWNWDFPIETFRSKKDLAAYVDTNLTAGSICNLKAPIDDPTDKDLVHAWYKPQFQAGDAYHNDMVYSSVALHKYVQKRYIT